MKEMYIAHRKGGAFPHCAAAEPQTGQRDAIGDLAYCPRAGPRYTPLP